jgi:hypothetical protein
LERKKRRGDGKRERQGEDAKGKMGEAGRFVGWGK